MTLTTESAPWQQVNMSALALRRFLMTLVAAEGVRLADDFKVSQRAAGANYSVDIAAGLALALGDDVAFQGPYAAHNDAAYNLTGFTAADGTHPRVDRVVLEVRDAFHGGAANDWRFAIVTGTPTSGATLANLTGAAAVGSNRLLLANVLIPATSTSITDANIDSSPLVRPVIVPAGAPTIYRAASEIDVVNTTTETALLSQVIAAGVLGTDKMLLVALVGDYLNNSGAGRDLTLRVKLGGTTFWTGTISGIGPSAGRRPIRIMLEIGNLGVAASQFMGGHVMLGDTAAGAPTFHSPVLPSAAMTINTAVAQTLEISAQHSAANASLSARRRYARVRAE